MPKLPTWGPPPVSSPATNGGEGNGSICKIGVGLCVGPEAGFGPSPVVLYRVPAIYIGQKLEHGLLACFDHQTPKPFSFAFGDERHDCV